MTYLWGMIYTLGFAVTLFIAAYTVGQVWPDIQKKQRKDAEYWHGAKTNWAVQAYRQRMFGAGALAVVICLVVAIAWPIAFASIPFFWGFRRGQRKTLGARELAKQNKELQAELDAIAKQEGLT